MLTNCSEIESLFRGMTYIQIPSWCAYVYPGYQRFFSRAVGVSVLAEAASAGHYKDLTETGNRTRKVSGTQGSVHLACEARNTSALHRLGNTRSRNTRERPGTGNPTLRP